MNPTIIAFLGVFLGVFFRTVLPYIRKMKEAEERGERLPFDFKYLGTAIFAFMVSLTVTLLTFPAFVIPEQAGIYIFCSAFGFGYASNDVINEVIAT